MYLIAGLAVPSATTTERAESRAAWPRETRRCILATPRGRRRGPRRPRPSTSPRRRGSKAPHPPLHPPRDRSPAAFAKIEYARRAVGVAAHPPAVELGPQAGG